MRRAPSGEELRREAMEARRVFAEQSLRMLPRAKRIAREFWGLVEALERRYAETVSKVWSLFQRALIEDVECYLRALGARSADDLMGIAIECYERLRPLSADLSWHLEWLKGGFVNELRRGYFASGGKEYLPGDLLNELEKEVRGYLAVRRRAVELSLRAGVEPPAPNGELESSLLGAWEAYMRLVKLQEGVIVRYPEGAYVASLYLACAVEFLRHLSTLARLIRRQEGRVAELEHCDYDPSCSALEVGELNVRREYLGLLRRILEGGRGEGWRVCRTATVAALELMPLAVVQGWAPTLYFRLLDRVSDVLLDSMHLAAAYAWRRAREVLGEHALKLGGLGFTYTWDKLDHERGPIHSVLRMREERNRRLLEGGCSTLEKLLIEQGIL